MNSERPAREAATGSATVPSAGDRSPGRRRDAGLLRGLSLVRDAPRFAERRDRRSRNQNRALQGYGGNGRADARAPQRTARLADGQRAVSGGRRRQSRDRRADPNAARLGRSQRRRRRIVQHHQYVTAPLHRSGTFPFGARQRAHAVPAGRFHARTLRNGKRRTAGVHRQHDDQSATHTRPARTPWQHALRPARHPLRDVRLHQPAGCRAGIMNLDTRNNLLSVVLMAGIGFLVLLGLAAFLLFGRADVESIAPARAPDSIIDRPISQNPELAELDEYTTIIERPMFFADRQLPVIEVAGAGEDEAEDEPEPVVEVEIPELEATVAGIIITPETKLAMTGDKSAWKIARIRPRGVEFETDGGKTEALELEVETAALRTGAPPRRQTAQAGQASDQDAPAEQAGGEDAEDQARARAEEIRRRVAERRAQLRAEAERRSREQDDGG